MPDIKSLWLCCLLSLSLLACNPSDNPEFTLHEAWINELVPGQTQTAGYFTLLNHTDMPAQLIGAKANIADRIELHAFDSKNGMMRMRRLASATVPAKGKLVFSTGQAHLMLLDVGENLRLRKAVSVTLLFSNNKQLIADFPIRRINGDKKTASQHH